MKVVHTAITISKEKDRVIPSFEELLFRVETKYRNRGMKIKKASAVTEALIK